MTDAYPSMQTTASPPRRTWHFIVGVFALAAAILGIGAISFAAFQRAVDTERTRTDAVARTTEGYEALLSAERVINTLQEAERSQRGYVLTENPIFLETYHAAVERTTPLFDTMQRRIHDGDNAQADRLRILRRLIVLKLDEMATSVKLTSAGRTEQARIDAASGYGRRLMEEVQAVMNELVTEQRRLLDLRQREVARRDAEGAHSIYRLAVLGVALLISAMISMMALAYMVYRTRLAVEREQASDVQRSVLEAAVADRTHELTQSNAALRAEIETREAAEARLRQAQRMEAVGQLTGGIAHDFNNMLAVVISSLDLLERRIHSDDPKVGRLIENAREGANRAATLTSRLLSFSRRQSLNPVTVNVNHLLTSILDLLKRTLGEHIRVETDFAADVPLIFIDPSELENAVINLAANARDAMPDGGTMTITTARRTMSGTNESGRELPRDYAMISVMDTGTGMSPEVVERVFEPFFTTKPVGKGTGLGLSQVYGFLHQSGGQIEIDSAHGQGTRVNLFFLQSSGDVPERRDVQAQAPSPQGQSDEAVLVVEDEKQLRVLTVESLRELGYTVLHAASGAEAMRIVRGHPGIGVLLTDVMMPDQTGDALAREVLALRPEISVLYTSGYARVGGEANAPLDPPAEVIHKPYTTQVLAAKVRECFDNRATRSVASQVSGS